MHLRTANLKQTAAFYQRVLGLELLKATEIEASLSAPGSGDALLVLSEQKDATPHLTRATGLYHFAIRFPERRDLANAYRRVLKNGYPIEGGSDHGVSEAIYLSDPDGNGIELYADRPRSEWHWEKGQIVMKTKRLDLQGLLATARTQVPLTAVPSRTDIGHIHLHVTDLVRAERFYAEFLGLSVTQRSYPGALFLAAGRYHHHIGVNTWAGNAAASGNSVGLISYRLEVPVAEILYCLSHRAPLMGFESHFETGARQSRLRIRDPNESWLEVQHRTGFD